MNYFKKIGAFLNNQLNLYDIESFYDRHAKEYQEKRLDKGMLFNDYIEFPAISEELKSFKKQPKKILDIGCGVGFYTKNLSYSADEVVSIDISQNMIDIAKENCKEMLSAEQLKKIKFLHTSLENYKAPEKYFDLVLATFMLGYFDNLDVLFNKVKNTISDTGKFITSTLHPFRMLSEKDKNGYYLTDYFGNGYYESNFISKEDKLKLKRWTFEEISKSAFDNGFLIEKLIEPKPILDMPEELKKNVDFYYRNPSILILVFRRK